MNFQDAENFLHWAKIEQDGVLEWHAIGPAGISFRGWHRKTLFRELTKENQDRYLWCIGVNPRTKESSLTSAKDADIQIWKNIYLDVEPIHAAGTNVSEDERIKCGVFANQLCDILWNETHTETVFVDSGNGNHLWYAIPPVDAQTLRRHCQGFHQFLLKATADMRQELNCRIDYTLSPSRQVKLYGTKKPLAGSRIASFPRVERVESKDFLEFIRSFEAKSPSQTTLGRSLSSTLSLTEIEEKYGLKDA